MLAFVAGAVSFTKAQGQGGGGQQGTAAERAQRTVDGQRFAAFSFTADQKTKVVALLTKLNTSSDSLMATVPAGGDRASLMPKRAEMSAAYEKVFISWLTPEQKKTYDTALAAAKEQNPNATGLLMGRGGRGGQGGGQGGQAPPPPPAPPK